MRIACVLLLLVAIGTAQARGPDAPVRPQPAEQLVDPEFGISSHAYALRREVQMLQWVPASQGDRLDWRDAVVPSTGLATGRRNPATLPFVAVQWQAGARMPDGAELPHALIARIGEWRLLQVDTARLPPNLTATFQSAGDVLTTAADPMAPQPGDLRLRWSELVLPDGAGFIEQDGRWVQMPAAVDDVAAAAATPATPGSVDDPGPRWRYWLAAALLLALVAAMAWRQHRQR